MLVLKNQPDRLHQLYEQNISNRVSSPFLHEQQIEKYNSLTIKNSVSYFNSGINESASAFNFFSPLFWKVNKG